MFPEMVDSHSFSNSSVVQRFLEEASEKLKQLKPPEPKQKKEDFDRESSVRKAEVADELVRHMSSFSHEQLPTKAKLLRVLSDEQQQQVLRGEPETQNHKERNLNESIPHFQMDPKEWVLAEVLEWLEDKGYCPASITKFRDHKMSGRAMFELWRINESSPKCFIQLCTRNFSLENLG